jgi:hypothetical protein
MGAGTGVSTFLRNMGSSLGVSILGSVYTHQLTSTLGATGGGKGTASVSSFTPAALRAMPEAVQHLFKQAVTSGITHLFLWGSVVAAAGFVVALFIQHVPLRGGKPVAAAESAEAAVASTATAADVAIEQPVG